MLFVLLTSPITGFIADKEGKNRSFLTTYTMVCVLAVAMFSLLEKGDVIPAFFLVFLANSAMEGALVFYNAFMPKIVPREFQGRLSAWGFGVGYLGSILSLLMALYLLKREVYGLIWPMVSLFFLIFSLPCLFLMPSQMENSTEKDKRSLRAHIQGLILQLREVFKKKGLRRFLLSYLLYEEGINTTIVFASIFASTSLGFRYNELVLLYLFVQLTALLGSFLVAGSLDKRGPKGVLIMTLSLWSSISFLCIWVDKKFLFWILAILSGLGLGSAQASSRAMFLKFVPNKMEGQYFGVYSMVGKSSAILGPLLFGEVSHLFGSQRPAVFVVFLMFLSGLLLLKSVEVLATGEGGGSHER